jgi:hypothetical protein
MGNAAMNTRALNRLSASGLRYRFSRCCICMVSIERLDWIDEDQDSDDEETSEILKCRNSECSRIFHRNCLGKYFERLDFLIFFINL